MKKFKLSQRMPEDEEADEGEDHPIKPTKPPEEED